VPLSAEMKRVVSTLSKLIKIRTMVDAELIKLKLGRSQSAHKILAWAGQGSVGVFIEPARTENTALQ